MSTTVSRMSISPSITSIHSAHSNEGSDNSSGGDSSPSGLPVEHEDIITLTQLVKTFRESLARLKQIFHPDRKGSGGELRTETNRVQAHERLGEVLRILRQILEKYPVIQSTELLMAAGNMIQRVKEHKYEDELANLTQYFDGIDQLAFTFSSRVSEYLMGDIDANLTSSRSRLSRENLVDSPEVTLSADQCDDRFLQLPEGIDLALHRTKLWSKYAKDLMAYIEKRAHLEAEYARNLAKLAHATKPLLKEEGFLPFQSIYCTALDQDLENSGASLATSSLLLGHKFLEPLTARRTEHERMRKQIKADWGREVKRMHESVSGLRKAKAQYQQRQADYERAKASSGGVGLGLATAGAAEVTGAIGSSMVTVAVSDAKVTKDKRRRVEDEASCRASEAEVAYRQCVADTNERAAQLERVKKELLVQIRELIYQCDQTMKAVTVCYFQLQHTISAPQPVQFQTLCESSRLYEPGAQYVEFVKRLPVPLQGQRPFPTYSFHAYSGTGMVDDAMSSSVRLKSLSDSESIESNDDLERRALPGAAGHSVSSGDELDGVEGVDSGYGASGGRLGKTGKGSGGPESPISRAAASHRLKKLKTPSRCRECDSYVYFQGTECSDCGLTAHKKCLETLRIKCGHKRLPRKMTTFGIALSGQRPDTVPTIVTKCVQEIDAKGNQIKGLYRVSGVKSHVEKLCQAFENGADLVDLSDVHPNVIANVLKLWLRQLPEPLLSFRLYPEFIRIAKDFPGSTKDVTPPPPADSDLTFDLTSMDSSRHASLTSDQLQEIEQLKRVTGKLPGPHYLTLRYLVHHLKRVADNHAENNMPSSNLGIVFGPTLLRTSEGGASLSSLVDTVHQTRVVELLITYAHDIFGGVEPVHGQTRATGHSISKSASQAIIRSSKTMDFGRADDASDRDPPAATDALQRAYSSSAIITLAGQKVITSSPTTGHQHSTPANVAAAQTASDLKRPSINELRRQFFTSQLAPPHFTGVRGAEPHSTSIVGLSAGIATNHPKSNRVTAGHQGEG